MKIIWCFQNFFKKKKKTNAIQLEIKKILIKYYVFWVCIKF